MALGQNSVRLAANQLWKTVIICAILKKGVYVKYFLDTHALLRRGICRTFSFR